MAENAPGANYLSSLSQIQLWVSGAIAVAATIITLAARAKIEPFESLPALWRGGVASVGVLAVALFVGRVIKLTAETTISAKVPWRISRRFNLLSEAQKQLLTGVFESGKRYFEVTDAGLRYIEELVEWGYVKHVSQLIIVSGSPDPLEITQAGWRELEHAIGTCA